MQDTSKLHNWRRLLPRGRRLWIVLAGGATILTVASFIGYLQFRQWQVAELWTALRNVRPGMTPAEVEAQFGGPPDYAGPVSGVFAYRGTVFLDQTNPLAAQHGTPTRYQVHQWARGPLVAVVFFDSRGRVHRKLAWNRSRTRSLSWANIRRAVSRLLP